MNYIVFTDDTWASNTAAVSCNKILGAIAYLANIIKS